MDELVTNLSQADQEILQAASGGGDFQRQKMIYYEQLYEMLKKQTKIDPQTHEPLAWHVANPTGMVLATQLTPRVLDAALQRWDHLSRTSEQDIDFKCRGADNKEEIFFREETWGGKGTKEFRLGDWILADIEPLKESEEGKQKIAFKQDEKHRYITRTLEHSKFQGTYRTYIDNKKPEVSPLSRFTQDALQNSLTQPGNSMRLYNVALIGYPEDKVDARAHGARLKVIIACWLILSHAAPTGERSVCRRSGVL